jgi:hypothetical protein
MLRGLALRVRAPDSAATEPLLCSYDTHLTTDVTPVD